MSKKIFIILCIPVILLSVLFMPKNIVVNAKNNYCEVVIDKNTGRILYSNNKDVKKYPASTTKILTAITVIENCDIKTKIKIKKSTTGIEGSSIYLKENEELTIEELLYGLMLRSGNDCAETLADYFRRDNFIDMMNTLSKKIGAKNSNFTNPHGLHDDNHYTTAYDLALITRYALNNETFKKIVSTKKIRIGKDDNIRLLINKNKMLNSFDGANGVKTGYTKKAGRCLVSSAIRDKKEFICVVLDCPPMFERSKELLSDCFNKYNNYTIFKKENIFDFINVDSKNVKCPVVIKNDVVLPLTKNEEKELKIEYLYKKNILSGTKKDTVIGKINFYIKNNLIFQEKI